jgi:2-(1,2-epoxy-1,2-dihydrophenyl)acetyl-CoA isomerase
MPREGRRRSTTVTESRAAAGQAATDRHLLVAVADGVGTITLNRPERRNALSTQMLTLLAGALTDLGRRDDVAALLLTGAGGAFCSGGDVREFNDRGGEGAGAESPDPRLVDRQRLAQRATVGAIYRSPKPVVAALPGPVAGAGIGLALAADLRIGSPRTVFATAFAGVGLAGDFGVAWLLDRIVGPAKARELLFLGPRLSGDECLRLGLVNRLVAEDELDCAAHDLARQLATGPSLALAGMKSNLLGAPLHDLEASMDAEVPVHKRTGTSIDHVDAVRAFVAKRRPEFPPRWTDQRLPVTPP